MAYNYGPIYSAIDAFDNVIDHDPVDERAAVNRLYVACAKYLYLDARDGRPVILHDDQPADRALIDNYVRTHAAFHADPRDDDWTAHYAARIALNQRTRAAAGNQVT